MTFSYHPGPNFETIHHYDSTNGDLIGSNGPSIVARVGGNDYNIYLPKSIGISILGIFRLGRRFARLDKINVVLNHNKDGLVIIYRKNIYFYSFQKRTLNLADQTLHARNALHGSLSVTKHGIYFGEYWSNPTRDQVPIWASRDDGRTWSIVHKLTANKVRHIHGIYEDPFSANLWITTGDFEGECYLIKASYNFDNVIFYGDGSQKWRAVGLFLDETRIVWGMDSPLEEVHLQTFDRITETLTTGRLFPGPVWYSKALSDGNYILQTSVESGLGSKSNWVHVFVSRDLINWTELTKFKKDPYPMKLLRFGLITFSSGSQNIDKFSLSGEAIEEIDGKSIWGKYG